MKSLLVTRNYLANADAIIFMFSYPKILNMQEEAMDEGMKNFEASLSRYLQEDRVRAKFGGIKHKLELHILGLINCAEELLSGLQQKLSENEHMIDESTQAFKAATDRKAEALKAHTEKIHKRSEDMKKRVNAAKAALRDAENKKVNIIQRLNKARDELKSKIHSAITRKYDEILALVPDFVKNMKTNHTITLTNTLLGKLPFMNNGNKEIEALADEIAGSLRKLFEREMVSWTKGPLKKLITDFTDDLRKKLEHDLESFYQSIDDFTNCRTSHRNTRSEFAEEFTLRRRHIDNTSHRLGTLEL